MTSASASSRAVAADNSAKPKLQVPKGTYALFTLVTLGAALGNLSQTGLNAMLPVAMESLGVGVEAGQWLTTGYMLVMGIAVPVATFLYKKLTDKAYVLLSFGLFTIGSLIDIVAPGFVSMLAGRVVQAIAVGLFVPLLQTVAMTRFPAGYQATAMGIAGIALGFAPNFGPTVGGMMDSAFGWRSFFVLLAAMNAALFMLAFALIRSEPRTQGDARFDTISFIFSTLGFGGVLLGLSQASSYGLLHAWFWGPLAVGAFFLVLFIARQHRLLKAGREPFMDLRIFQSNTFVDGLTASIFLFACYMGITLVIPLYVQNVLGGSSLDSGMVMLPAVFTALIVNPLSGILADKTSVRLVSILFGSFLVVGSIGSVFIGDSTPLEYLTFFQTIRSIGVSGCIGPLMTYTLSGLAGPLTPHGSTASVIVRQIAGTFGTAIMVFCIAAFSGMGNTLAFPYQAALTFSALMSVLCLLMVLFRVKIMVR